MIDEIRRAWPRLRIAVLAHLHHPIAPPFAGGMEAHTAHLVAGLVARGHDVTLFAKEDSRVGTDFIPVLGSGYMVDGYPDSDGHDQQHRVLDGAMDFAVRTIRQGGFDAVVNNSLSPLPHSDLASIPTLHVLHTPVLPRLQSIFSAAGWEADPLHRFVTVSHANARQWQELLPSLEVVHNGIDPYLWDYRLAPTPGCAAWTGRITPEKGTHLAIAAARTAKMKLRIAGPIQDPEYFASLIEPELDADITYLGHLDQSQIAQMITSSEVFISSPLWEEPFGLTTLEAIVCGTPVAALPSGAMTEIIGPAAGVVAAHKNSYSLAEAALTARTMNRIAVRESGRWFSLERMITAYEERLRTVVLTKSELCPETS